MRRGAPRVILIAAILVSLIGCDRAAKGIARATLASVEEPISLLGDTVRLTYAENRGAFLGLGGGLPERARFWILVVPVALGLALLLVHVLRAARLRPIQVVALSLVIAGGFGNLIDRVAAGAVVDFLNVGLGALRTGIFNVADVGITAGALLLLADAFRPHRPQEASSG